MMTAEQEARFDRAMAEARQGDTPRQFSARMATMTDDEFRAMTARFNAVRNGDA